MQEASEDGRKSLRLEDSDSAGKTNNNVCHKNYAINFALKASKIMQNAKCKAQNRRIQDSGFKIQDSIRASVLHFAFCTLHF
jgi:hypothetical protein